MKKLLLLLFLIPSLLYAAPPSRIYTYTSGEVIDPSKVTSNEDAIFNYLSRGVDTFSGTLTTAQGGTGSTSTTYCNLTTNVTSTLPVANGGTGATTLTDGGILLGSGTGAITALGVATNGQIPIGDGTTDPVLATITGTADEVDVANGAGTITIGLVNPLATSKGGTGATAAANAANGVVVLDASSKLPAVDGSQLTGLVGFGAWAAKNADTVYQATTDGFVVASCSDQGLTYTVYSDTSNPPTTARTQALVNYHQTSIVCPIRKGDYWKLTSSSGSGVVNYLFWLPLGS